MVLVRVSNGYLIVESSCLKHLYQRHHCSNKNREQTELAVKGPHSGVC